MANEQERATAREAVERRLQGGQLLLDGLTPRAVALRVGVSRQTAYAWKALLVQGGCRLEVLKRLDSGGRRAPMSKADIQRLEGLLLDRPDLRPPSGWTLKRVSALIERQFGLTLSLPQVWRVLVGLDLSTRDATDISRGLERLRKKGLLPAVTAMEAP